jgi:hypothetical protein
MATKLEQLATLTFAPTLSVSLATARVLLSALNSRAISSSCDSAASCSSARRWERLRDELFTSGAMTEFIAANEGALKRKDIAE